MYNRNDKSKVLSPIWGVVPAILALVLAGLFFWFSVRGIFKGELYTLSCHNDSTLIVRLNEPGRFWYWVGLYILCGLISCSLVYNSIKFLFISR